jgi:hypothetical protein
MNKREDRHGKRNGFWSRSPRSNHLNAGHFPHQEYIQKLDTDLSENLAKNVRALQAVYSRCSDVIFHEFCIGNGFEAVLAYTGVFGFNEVASRLALLINSRKDSEKKSGTRQPLMTPTDADNVTL